MLIVRAVSAAHARSTLTAGSFSYGDNGSALELGLTGGDGVDGTGAGGDVCADDGGGNDRDGPGEGDEHPAAATKAASSTDINTAVRLPRRTRPIATD